MSIVFFSIITFSHFFFRTCLRLRPEGDTDHLILVGFPPGFPALRFLRTAADFCPLDILSATAFGRHAGYFLFDLPADLRPHGFPVATSRQSSLNHFRSPPLYAIYAHFLNWSFILLITLFKSKGFSFGL